MSVGTTTTNTIIIKCDLGHGFLQCVREKEGGVEQAAFKRVMYLCMLLIVLVH